MRFLIFVVDELGCGCCGVGGDGGVVAVGGAVLLYYDCEVFVGVGFWSDGSDLSDGCSRERLLFFFWQPRTVAFLVLSEVCRFCANDVRTIL